MAKSRSKTKRMPLQLTRHAKQRMTERDLWPVLGQIVNIAHHPSVPRFRDLSSDGRPVERVEIDGVCLVLARPSNKSGLTLLTVHSGSEVGAQARARINTISRNLNKRTAA
jgi:hypothetical protein